MGIGRQYKLKVNLSMCNSNYKTRCETKLWLLDNYLSLKDTETGRIIFFDSSPPTVKDVLLNFKGQHSKLQEETKRQSKARHAAEKTVFEVVKWWKRTGIELKTEEGLIKMILNLHEKYQGLQKNKKSSSTLQKLAWENCLEECKMTF